MISSSLRVLALEPFAAGSHAAFLDTLKCAFRHWTELRMPGRHWKWRMRGSAAWWALRESEVLNGPHELILASSYLPLAELRGLRPGLADRPALMYFHENQLAFPGRGPEREDRDLHYAFTQLVSALAARRCLFNSQYNRQSFLDGAKALLARMPDRVPAAWLETLRQRSEVLPYPVPLQGLREHRFRPSDANRAPLLLWNHRWEHDKNPEECFAALETLQQRGVEFRLAVCGQRFSKAPACFERARQRLGERLVQFGPLADRDEYRALLGQSDLVLSTARQEFFGVSVVEAVAAGARPLVPDRLAYPELWPAKYRYAEGSLLETLESLLGAAARGEQLLRADRSALVEPLSARSLLPHYVERFEQIARPG